MLLILVVMLAASVGMSVAVIRPEPYQRFWQRWYRQMRIRDPAMTAVKCVRLAIPSMLLMWALFTVCVLAVFSGATETKPAGPARAPGGGAVGTDLVVVGLAVLGAIVLLGVLLLVVGRTGRPKVFVLRPCRDMTEHEVEAWLTPAEDRPLKPSRRWHRSDP